MFTKKQITELIPILDKGDLSELTTPEIPSPLYADWLPKQAKEVIDNWYNLIAPQKTNKARLVFDMYEQAIREFIEINPLFIHPSMQKVWVKLEKVNPDKLSDFTRLIMHAPNDFIGALAMYFKHVNEVQSAKKMLSKARQLLEALEEYQAHYYGHMLFDKHGQLVKILERMIIEVTEKKDLFAPDVIAANYATESAPITREIAAPHAQATYYIRKFGFYFRQEFGKPMNSYVADMVNILFNTTYTDNNVARIIATWKK